MGIPKAFRWFSERYPAISQLIADNQIPEFDCLYLDMNGIIHNCTHKDSDSPAFRMTEDQMFIDIFNYIEHLFSKIKPKQLFFMAIDGVAPRAKMNQQRARRFRTALDAENAREKAIREGVEMPKEPPFDSNCITPGTDFMARLTQHLKYFVNKKVSEDVDWQGVEVVLSGHEVPGEGEHKIMEYIRQAKSQKNYEPNRRHCLYGLDADLIMLGLLSHDPHFCLLREEVTFGRASKTKSKELEHQNFFLMHLSIFREYLELEFQELKDPDVLGFPFDLEQIIDDFILMAFFVGNDFLPNLPHLHINEGALSLMFSVYKTALPKAKGYVNEGGVINMKRLELLLDELSHVEFRFFESENSDAKWFKGKQMAKEDVMERGKRKGQLTISSHQQGLFKEIEEYVRSRTKNAAAPPFDLPVSLTAGDRKFVEELADSLHLQWSTVSDDEGNRHMQLNFPPSLDQLDGEEEESSEDDEEAQLALNRVLKRYRTAKIVNVSADDAQAAMEKKYEEQFQSWKNDHYVKKFNWDMNNEEEMKKLTENYVQGLQWVLYYYYRGIASWPWFYGYHYSPMISDVKKGLGADINFQLGQPFRPYQQLMGVLPDRSKAIVPEAYHPLMTDPKSPIIDFYPRQFELDMDGKKMEWEAVVKIPFIEEKRLLEAMATREHLLTPEQNERNSFGVSLKFVYSPTLDFVYPSSLPGFFPDLEHCHGIENIFELPTMHELEVYVGLVEGSLLGVQALAGFPSLYTLPFNAQLGFHGVNVFQQESRNESMVVTLADSDAQSKMSVAKGKLGKSVFVGYPFLQEAKVVKVSDDLFDYVLDPKRPSQVVAIPHQPRDIEEWKKTANRIEKNYSKKLGIIIGDVESLLHVEMLKGLIKTSEGSTVKEYGIIPGTETDFATQVIVDEVYSADQRFLEKAAVPIDEEFPVEYRAFFLGDFAYGRPLAVKAHSDDKTSLTIYVSVLSTREPEFGRDIAMRAENLSPYTPSFAVAKMLRLHPLALSKLTSSLSVNSGGLRLNLGLNLKFEAKKLKVLGYSRKADSGWEYSNKAIELIKQYMLKFPEFIAGISMNPSGNIYDDTQFYPQEIARDKMKEIGAWLKSIESKSFEKVPLEAEQLDSDIVMKIQEAAIANLDRSQQVFKMLKGVPRNALLNPIDAEQRIRGQRFSLGDRVVYVLNSGRVPIAQRGTVVGLTRTARQTLLDVVFDTTFMSGTTLGDRCSPFHGSTVPSDAVLNLTDRQVVATSRAQAARTPAPSIQPLTVGGYGATYGRQSVPASAPPPLRGSFRAAAAGQTNGRGASPNYGRGRGQDLPLLNGRGRSGYAITSSRGNAAGTGALQGQSPGRGASNGTFRGPNRGRGRGANQQGYTVVDQDDLTEGVKNTNFRPRGDYRSVPPPASLDGAAPQPGRGRGGSNSRGGRGERGERGGRGHPRARGRGAVA